MKNRFKIVLVFFLILSSNEIIFGDELNNSNEESLLIAQDDSVENVSENSNLNDEGSSSNQTPDNSIDQDNNIDTNKQDANAETDLKKVDEKKPVTNNKKTKIVKEEPAKNIEIFGISLLPLNDESFNTRRIPGIKIEGNTSKSIENSNISEKNPEINTGETPIKTDVNHVDNQKDDFIKKHKDQFALVLFFGLIVLIFFLYKFKKKKKRRKIFRRIPGR